MELRPQKGKQEQFLSSSADIAIYGGSAGGGKTYALLLEALRNISKKGFGVVIFRKNLNQITKEGGLWDTAETIYPFVGGRAVRGNLVYYFDAHGTKIQFAHIERDQDVLKWQGTQIPLICFDELTHFSKKQFFYMLSRNRSVSGVKPYVRATTNPDVDSWVREFIDWWIDNDGLPIEERSGKLRWLVHLNNEYIWFNSKEEALEKYPHIPPKSVTFIPSTIYDNKILLENDPDYLSNLHALDRVEKQRLLYGNWNARLVSGDYFKKSDFELVDAHPKLTKIVRCWDLAGTEPSESNPDPDYTVGLKVGKCEDGWFWVLDMVRFRKRHSEVKRIYYNTLTQDGKQVFTTVPKDVGSAGKAVASELVKLGAGYPVKAKQVTGSKEARAKLASGQAGVGNIKVLKGKWNNDFFRELEEFPFGIHDDIVDALSDCIDELTSKEAVKVIKKPKNVR
jgi:predicted phage terminase large subunit-like protein